MPEVRNTLCITLAHPEDTRSNSRIKVNAQEIAASIEDGPTLSEAPIAVLRDSDDPHDPSYGVVVGKHDVEIWFAIETEAGADLDAAAEQLLAGLREEIGQRVLRVEFAVYTKQVFAAGEAA